MFGRKQPVDQELQLQREFHRNCLEQIADLEHRVTDEAMALLRNQFIDVWVDDQPTRELPGKVALARRYATDLGDTLAKSSTPLQSMDQALDKLQAIIDHCEHAVQVLLANLVARQSLTSIKKGEG